MILLKDNYFIRCLKGDAFLDKLESRLDDICLKIHNCWFHPNKKKRLLHHRDMLVKHEIWYINKYYKNIICISKVERLFGKSDKYKFIVVVKGEDN